jgi:hypothetical protein
MGFSIITSDLLSMGLEKFQYRKFDCELNIYLCATPAVNYNSTT